MAIAEFAQKRANSAIATFALVAKLCKFHICNIFEQGKFDANSFFRPVKLVFHNGVPMSGDMIWSHLGDFDNFLIFLRWQNKWQLSVRNYDLQY